MSDHFIALIPSDPRARLETEVLERLRQKLAAFCATDETRIKDFSNRLQFIDCGENLESIHCPVCKSDIEIDWWGQRMDHAWNDDEGFHLCAIELPCCGAATQLDELIYAFPQGFATWFVSARNPGRGPLSQDETAELETVADTPLTVIYQMY